MKREDSASSPVNVKVILRCRPLSDHERRDVSNFVVVSTRSDSKEVVVSQTIPGRRQEFTHSTKTFTFDNSFGPSTSQSELFNSCVSPIVDEVLLGFNCTIFAYGQTGTGKTYTMEGDFAGVFDDNIQVDDELPNTAGIIPRAVQKVFQCLDATASEHSVRVSYLEIYNEELNDLLVCGPKQELRIYEDTTGKKGLSVDKLEEVPVNNPRDIFNILATAVKKRRTAETILNRQSSRSHCIFSIIIHIKETNVEGEDVIKIGKLNLVDLAGSENIQRSGANAIRDRAKEAGMINQSLLTLGRVINALVEHSTYIPYRDSKLTRLLQDSLGGRTKTCIVATVSPSSLCLEESLSTLDYAHRAKNIRNRPEINQKMTKRVMIRELTCEIERLKSELQAAREKNGVYMPYDRFQQLEMRNSNQAQEICECLAEINKRNSEKVELVNRVANLREEIESLRGSNQEAVNKLQRDLATSLEKLTFVTKNLIEEKVVTSKLFEKENRLLINGKLLQSSLGDAKERISALVSRLRDHQSRLALIRTKVHNFLDGDFSVGIVGAIRDLVLTLLHETDSLLNNINQIVTRQSTAELTFLTETLGTLDSLSSLSELDSVVERSFSESQSKVALEATKSTAVINSKIERWRELLAQATAAAQSLAGEALGQVNRLQLGQAHLIDDFREAMGQQTLGMHTALDEAKVNWRVRDEKILEELRANRRAMENLGQTTRDAESRLRDRVEKAAQDLRSQTEDVIRKWSSEHVAAISSEASEIQNEIQSLVSGPAGVGTSIRDLELLRDWRSSEVDGLKSREGSDAKLQSVGRDALTSTGSGFDSLSGHFSDVMVATDTVGSLIDRGEEISQNVVEMTTAAVEQSRATWMHTTMEVKSQIREAADRVEHVKNSMTSRQLTVKSDGPKLPSAIAALRASVDYHEDETNRILEQGETLVGVFRSTVDEGPKIPSSQELSDADSDDPADLPLQSPLIERTATILNGLSFAADEFGNLTLPAVLCDILEMIAPGIEPTTWIQLARSLSTSDQSSLDCPTLAAVASSVAIFAGFVSQLPSAEFFANLIKLKDGDPVPTFPAFADTPRSSNSRASGETGLSRSTVLGRPNPPKGPPRPATAIGNFKRSSAVVRASSRGTPKASARKVTTIGKPTIDPMGLSVRGLQTEENFPPTFR